MKILVTEAKMCVQVRRMRACGAVCCNVRVTITCWVSQLNKPIRTPSVETIGYAAEIRLLRNVMQRKVTLMYS